MRLQYSDADGDLCTITSSMEWTEMSLELANQTVFRLSVAEGEAHGRYFKDGPVPQLISAYTDSAALSTSELPDDVPSKVTKALANLFPGGKILPHNLPSFLENVVKIKTRDDRSVDLDVDVPQLSTALHNRAYHLILNSTRTSDLKEAKACLISQLVLAPKNHIALYNLACAESLMGNLPAAITALRSSIQEGFLDVSYMSTDRDLQNLHGLPEFQALVRSVRAGEVIPVAVPVAEVVVLDPIAQLFSPEPVSEPVLEPVVSEPIAIQPKKYEQELQVLAEMGFLDESMLLEVLEQTGSVEQTLNSLLG